IWEQTQMTQSLPPLKTSHPVSLVSYVTHGTNPTNHRDRPTVARCHIPSPHNRERGVTRIHRAATQKFSYNGLIRTSIPYDGTAQEVSRVYQTWLHRLPN